MLRQNSSRIDPERDDTNQRDINFPQTRGIDVDIQRELNKLEELILDSLHIPLTGWTIVEEDSLLDQLDLVRMNLPDAFEQALALLREKENILIEAEDYGQDIIETAEQRAAQILDETGIVRQAEHQANKIRQQVQQECEELQQKTITEIEQMRRSTQQELEQLRQLTIAECDDIQDGADDYADAVLNRIEQQLGEMLRIIRNGRQQLNSDFSPHNSPDKDSPRKSI